MLRVRPPERKLGLLEPLPLVEGTQRLLGGRDEVFLIRALPGNLINKKTHTRACTGPQRGAMGAS